MEAWVSSMYLYDGALPTSRAPGSAAAGLVGTVPSPSPRLRLDSAGGQCQGTQARATNGAAIGPLMSPWRAGGKDSCPHAAATKPHLRAHRPTELAHLQKCSCAPRPHAPPGAHLPLDSVLYQDVLLIMLARAELRSDAAGAGDVVH